MSWNEKMAGQGTGAQRRLAAYLCLVGLLTNWQGCQRVHAERGGARCKVPGKDGEDLIGEWIMHARHLVASLAFRFSQVNFQRIFSVHISNNLGFVPGIGTF